MRGRRLRFIYWRKKVSFLCPILEVIHYIDIESPSLGEMFETFDNMLGLVKIITLEKHFVLVFYMNYIQSIIQHVWDQMNIIL